MGQARGELGGAEAIRSGGCSKTSGQEEGRVQAAGLESGTAEGPFAGATLGMTGGNNAASAG